MSQKLKNNHLKSIRNNKFLKNCQIKISNRQTHITTRILATENRTINKETTSNTTNTIKTTDKAITTITTRTRTSTEITRTIKKKHSISEKEVILL